MMFEVPEVAVCSINFNAVPDRGKVTQELAEVVFWLIAHKAFTLPFNEAAEGPKEIYAGMLDLVKRGVKDLVEKKEINKNNHFTDKKLKAIKDAPYLICDKKEVGVLEFVPYDFKGFTSSEARLAASVHKITMSLSALSMKTTCFDPEVEYPIIKSRAKQLKDYPRSQWTPEGTGLLMLNAEMYEIAKKVLPSLICKRSLQEVNSIIEKVEEAPW